MPPIDGSQQACFSPAVITDLLARPALALDPDHVATVGHSLGGKISTLAASGDPRIDAVVGWDPVDSSSPSVAPQLMGALHAVVAVIGETTNATGGTGGMSCAPAAENYAQFYAAAKSPAVAITVAGADHMDWVDDPSCGFCTLCTAGTAAPELVRAATRRLTVAWLRLQLLADASMMPWVMQPPEAGLTVQAR
ncbi:MAG: hypothetical protein NT062_19235 [Proteobacteria bacterium]|nr:hypothetical protein [Pseudomonadota bacterium]